jgi:hypothetical protein
VRSIGSPPPRKLVREGGLESPTAVLLVWVSSASMRNAGRVNNHTACRMRATGQGWTYKVCFQGRGMRNFRARRFGLAEAAATAL